MVALQLVGKQLAFDPFKLGAADVGFLGDIALDETHAVIGLAQHHRGQAHIVIGVEIDRHGEKAADVDAVFGAIPEQIVVEGETFTVHFVGLSLDFVFIPRVGIVDRREIVECGAAATDFMEIANGG